MGAGLGLLGRHIDNSNTHGTGCSLSSALASELALGHTLPEAAQLAKDYVALGIEHGLPVGQGTALSITLSLFMKRQGLGNDAP